MYPPQDLPPLPAGIEQEYQRIRAYPDDDLPRLVYADWLDERGDPRGEFIRLQIARARLEKLIGSSVGGGCLPEGLRRLHPAYYQAYVRLRQRENLLLVRHRAEWLTPFRGLISGEEFRRGFVESVKIAARTFLEHAARLFALTPLRHVQILDLDAWADALAVCPFLDRLEALTIHAQHSGPALAIALARSPYLSGLRRLRLSRNRLGDEGLAQLVRRPWPSLEELDLTHNDLSPAAARLLHHHWRHLPRLHTLQLRDNNLGLSGAAQLVDGPLARQIIRLGLAGNQIGQTCDLSALGNLLTISEVDLSDNGLSPSAVPALLTVPTVVQGNSLATGAQVRWLDLSRNELGDAGAQILARASCLSELQVLHLAWCNIGDVGARALATARFPKLHTLDLSNNPIGSEGFRYFTDPFVLRLTALRHLLRTTLTLPPRLGHELDRRFPLVPEWHVSAPLQI
ncbi:MAG: TIGR02996 domain-containing protein [Thermogemmata sp.]|nr:TIGR02996 domain-containing protein [Thermogemmata sp.]